MHLGDWSNGLQTMQPCVQWRKRGKLFFMDWNAEPLKGLLIRFPTHCKLLPHQSDMSHVKSVLSFLFLLCARSVRSKVNFASILTMHLSVNVYYKT